MRWRRVWCRNINCLLFKAQFSFMDSKEQSCAVCSRGEIRFKDEVLAWWHVSIFPAPEAVGSLVLKYCKQKAWQLWGGQKKKKKAKETQGDVPLTSSSVCQTSALALSTGWATHLREESPAKWGHRQQRDCHWLSVQLTHGDKGRRRTNKSHVKWGWLLAGLLRELAVGATR